MAGTDPPRRRWRWLREWPWLILVLVAVPAVWHVVDFPEEPDDEFPTVTRPTFSRFPPPAYRLAEPGDTIDHVAIYATAGGIVLAILAGLRSLTLGQSDWKGGLPSYAPPTPTLPHQGGGRPKVARLLGRGGLGGGGMQAQRATLLEGPSARGRDLALWPSALGLELAAFWHASTPWPTFDGWHGWGWRVIANSQAPGRVRLAVGALALLLGLMVLFPIRAAKGRWRGWCERGRERGVLGLVVAALILVALRQGDYPSLGPPGYWARWAFVGGVVAFNLALIRLFPPLPKWFACVLAGLAGGVAVTGLIHLGWAIQWYHRPIERLRAVVPGQIYISAMPTREGLEVEYQRIPFKTIINLFPEETDRRNTRLPGELRFVREHRLRYIGSPTGAVQADPFLDLTLALAQNPRAWPILIHCHGSRDRSPAWMGIYRFVVQGRPLREILSEIEQHRGYRPKASVTLLYNRVLPPRAPERFARDPTARLLLRCAEGTRDPFYDQLEDELRRANLDGEPRVSRRNPPDSGAAATLTPRGGPLELSRTPGPRILQNWPPIHDTPVPAQHPVKTNCSAAD